MITHLATDDLRLQELRGTILQFDEVLTMSARMAAATGDLSWEERYRQFEPALDAAIKEAIHLAPEVYHSEAAAQTDEANLRLVEMENRAFELVRQDELDAATQLLFSAEYEKQKEVYADGMQKLDSALGGHVQEQIEHYHGRVLWMGTLGAVAIVVLTVGWIAAFVAVQTHLKKRMFAEEALKNAQRDLALRVEERTNDLAQANQELCKSVSDLERFNRLAVGREKRMIELKREVNELLATLGREEEYAVSAQECTAESTPAPVDGSAPGNGDER